MSPTVSFDDLLAGFDWVNGAPGENEAFVSRERGTVHWTSISYEVFDEPPADLNDPALYLAIPHKRDLDLGNALPLRFVQEQLPDSYPLVAGFFRERGGHARFKDFLEEQGLLADWYVYEERAVEAALRQWCAEQGLTLTD